MNRYLSVFGLAARSTLYKLIGVIAIMGAVQTGMFLYALNNADGSMLLENLIDQSKIAYAFGVGFLAYYIILCGSTSNAVMVTHRLSIRERVANWIISIYNGMALVIFLAAELGICLALSKVYLSSDVSGSYEHVLFTAFYRSDLLHSLLPLEDYVTLAADILFVIELSIIAAYSQQQSRRGKRAFFAGAAAAVTVIDFLQSASNPGITGAVIVGFMAIFATVYITKGGAVDEDTIYTEPVEAEATADAENL